LGQKKFKIILTQGLNRQIRRMCEFLGYKVQSLKRVRIMNIKLDLQTGKYREFTKEELLELNKLLENSSSTFD
jgi:23S rRNA pseudouridine2604 synthase/16S rRNA pseudouridine516 synthase